MENYIIPKLIKPHQRETYKNKQIKDSQHKETEKEDRPNKSTRPIFTKRRRIQRKEKKPPTISLRSLGVTVVFR